jgi:hypothetical protein
VPSSEESVCVPACPCDGVVSPSPSPLALFSPFPLPFVMSDTSVIVAYVLYISTCSFYCFLPLSFSFFFCCCASLRNQHMAILCSASRLVFVLQNTKTKKINNNDDASASTAFSLLVQSFFNSYILTVESAVNTKRRKRGNHHISADYSCFLNLLVESAILFFSLRHSDTARPPSPSFLFRLLSLLPDRRIKPSLSKL